MASTHLLWSCWVVVSLFGSLAGASPTQPQHNNYYVIPISLKQSAPLVRHGRRLVAASGKLDIDGSVRVGYFQAALPLGTPPQMFNVIVDTGSTVTYVPCNDCKHCGTHNSSPFNPSHSPTSKWVSCGDQQCKQLDTYRCDRVMFPGQCVYSIAYAEQSTSQGRLIQDVFTFPHSHMKVPITFGCEDGESGEIYRQKADGLIGMGNSGGAFHSQLAAAGAIPHVFSLCFGFPTGGAMLLGDAPVPSNPTYAWTPFSTSGWGDYYSLGLDKITFGGQNLAVPAAMLDIGYRTVLDSGTTFIYLVSPAFKRFSAAVIAAAAAGGLSETTDSYGDMCWSGAGPDFADIDRYFPVASFIFAGGAELSLPPYRYLSQQSRKGTYCLGVFDNGSQGSLIGGIAVRNVLVKYDMEHQRVGFADVDCQALGKLPAEKFTHEDKKPTALPAPAAAAAASAAAPVRTKAVSPALDAPPVQQSAASHHQQQQQQGATEQQQHQQQSKQHAADSDDVLPPSKIGGSSSSSNSSSSSGGGNQGVIEAGAEQQNPVAAAATAAAAPYREVSAAVVHQQQQQQDDTSTADNADNRQQAAVDTNSSSDKTASTNTTSTTAAVSEDLLVPSLPINTNSSSSSNSSGVVGVNATDAAAAAAAPLPAAAAAKVYWGTGSSTTGLGSTDHSSSNSSSSSSGDSAMSHSSAATVIVLSVLLGALLLAAAAAVAYVVRRRQIKAAGFSQVSGIDVDCELAGIGVSNNINNTSKYNSNGDSAEQKRDRMQGYTHGSSSSSSSSSKERARGSPEGAGSVRGSVANTRHGISGSGPAAAAAVTAAPEGAELIDSSRDAVKSPTGGRDQQSPRLAAAPAAAAAAVGGASSDVKRNGALPLPLQQQHRAVGLQQQRQQQHVAVFSLDTDETTEGIPAEQQQQQQEVRASDASSLAAVGSLTSTVAGDPQSSRGSMDVIALD